MSARLVEYFRYASSIASRRWAGPRTEQQEVRPVTLAGKQELLDRMEIERAAWDALIARFSEERMLEPGIESDWSLKDVIAHVAMYENWTADQIEAALRGEEPGPEMRGETDEPWFDVDWRNARAYEWNK